MPNTLGVVAYPVALDDSVSLLSTANNAVTALTANVAVGDATITVASTTGFPSSNGTLSIDNEIIYYSGTTSTTFTGCVRGQDGTAAATHTSPAPVNQYITRGHRQLLRDAVIATETKLGSGASTPAAGHVLKGTGAGASGWAALSAADIATALGYNPVRSLFAGVTPSSAIANTTTETAFSVSAPLAANSLAVGQALRVTARGVYSASSAINLTLALRLNTGTVQTYLITTNAQAVTALTSLPWMIDAIITVTAIGASAAVNVSARRAWATAAIGTEGVAGLFRGSAISFDSTVAQTLELTAKWSAAAAADTTTLEQLVVETLN